MPPSSQRDVLHVALRWHAMKVWGLSYGEADERAQSLLASGGPLADLPERQGMAAALIPFVEAAAGIPSETPDYARVARVTWGPRKGVWLLARHFRAAVVASGEGVAA